MGAMDRRKAWQRRLNEGRWAAITWPAEWGGRDATVTQSVIYSEEMARAKTPGIFNANGLWQIGPMIIRWGTDEQKDRWLPGILDADEHWCQGFSEPEAGSDLANLRTMAVLDEKNGEYVLNGQKIWISTRPHRRLGPVPRAHRPDRHRAGREARGHHRVHRRHGHARHRVPADPRHRRRRDVQRGVLHRRPRAGRLPAGRRGRRLAGRHGHARPRAGRHRRPRHRHEVRPRGDDRHGPLREPGRPRRPRAARAHRPAYTHIEFTRLLNYRALSKILKGEPNWPEVPIAKLQWSLPGPDAGRAGRRPARPGRHAGQGRPDAVDGGTWNRLYVFQRYTSIGAGTTEVQKNIIADRAIKLPRR